MRKTAAAVMAAVLAAGTAAVSVSAALPAYASSPEFARSAEEWAALKDNKMEYWEIEGLIQEYNPTVQQNQYSYVKFRRDYGDTKDDVSNEYRRLADELRRDIEYPSDNDDPSYAALSMAALTSEMTARQLDTQADNNLEDSEIRRLTYEMAEKTLAQTAQNNFVGLYSAWDAVRQSELKKQLAELNLAAVQAQAAVGAGTQIQVLTAQQAVQDAGAALINAQSTADNNLAAALENNYTLRINKKKLQNSTGETDVKTLQSTIADNEARIASSLQTAYLNVIAAKNSYLYLQSAAALAEQTAAQTAQRYALGTASRLDYETAQVGAEQAQLAFRQAEYALLQVMKNYEWAVKGLAAASAG